MWIIGCDLHTRYQQVAAMNKATGELLELRLEHQGDAVRKFYAALPAGSLVGIEATGYTQWFESLLAELGHELWIGDAAEIRAASVRQQKTDTRDAQLLLQLLLEKRFPRLWLPSPEDREKRRLLLHRVKLVRLRTMVRNQLHALALSQGLRRGSKLWTQRGQHELAALPLGRFSSEQRRDLLELAKLFDQRIDVLNREVAEQAAQRPEAVRLMQHPGVGPMTALAFVLTLGPVTRFRRSKQVVSYLGLNPREYSSGGRQRLGAISKQGNTLTRWLLVEAAQTAARLDPELHRDYLRLKHRRGARIAKVAIARKLAVRLYWKLRTPETNAQWVGPQNSPCTVMVEATPSNS
jgi:transposase